MPRIGRELDYAILELLEATSKSIKAVPINLGGISGPGGGVGVPPAGFVGQLSQTKVAYDTSEIGTAYTPASGASLLDNLNHIRHRLNVLESGGGSITVMEYGGSPTVSPTTTIIFSGADVFDLGGGQALVAISGGGGGGGLADAPSDGFLYGRKNASWQKVENEFLKLNAGNGPLTGKLNIIPTTAGTDGLYVETNGDAYGVDVEQYTSSQNLNSPTLFLYRETSGAGNITAAMIEGLQNDLSTGAITGGFIKLDDASSGKFFYVDKDGNVDIPVNSKFRIGGSPIVSSVNGLTDVVSLDARNIAKISPPLTLFMRSTSSNISGYYSLSKNVGNSTFTSTAILTAPDTLIEEFIADAGIFEFIPRQVVNVWAWVNKNPSGTTKDWVCYAKLFHRTSGGTETLIGTTNTSPTIYASAQFINLTCEVDDKYFSPTDRLVIKFYGSPTGSGSDPEAYLIYNNTSSASRVILGVNSFSKASEISVEDSGGFLTATNVESALAEIVSKKEILIFGGHGVGGTVPAGGTYYIAPFVAGLDTVGRSAPIPVSGTLKNLYIRLAGSQPATGSLVVEIYAGATAGTATGISITIPAGSPAGTYSNTVNTFNHTAGDLVHVRITNNATSNSAPIGGVTFGLLTNLI